jgi:hypothetical protein
MVLPYIDASGAHRAPDDCSPQLRIANLRCGVVGRQMTDTVRPAQSKIRSGDIALFRRPPVMLEALTNTRCAVLYIIDYIFLVLFFLPTTNQRLVCSIRTDPAPNSRAVYLYQCVSIWAETEFFRLICFCVREAEEVSIGRPEDTTEFRTHIGKRSTQN